VCVVLCHVHIYGCRLLTNNCDGCIQCRYRLWLQECYQSEDELTDNITASCNTATSERYLHLPSLLYIETGRYCVRVVLFKRSTLPTVRSGALLLNIFVNK
jgi:hypothetical protein